MNIASSASGISLRHRRVQRAAFPGRGLDFDAANIAKLNSGRPAFRAGTERTHRRGLAAKNLLSPPTQNRVRQADILWLCYDTPVNEDDESDVDFVLGQLCRALPHLPKARWY